MKTLKPVAAYLRKSRDEENDPDVLKNHRMMLEELCEKEGYDPTFYEEIGSSEKISYRTAFPQLLEDVATGKYYAVIARDTDRLSRGDVLTNPDITTIYNTLANSNTIIHTVIDGKKDPKTDGLYLSIKALFANMEYEAIKKRLYDGKVQGAKRGKWTNGKPPFPYYYNRETKELLIDKEKLPHYRMMIELYLQTGSIVETATGLNKRGIPSPAGKNWSTTSINRLLRHEVHLGYVVMGKTKVDENNERVSVKNRDEWVVAKGKHEPVKTQEEHDRIMASLTRNEQLPPRTRHGVYPLSGLMYCSICGRRLTFRTQKHPYKTYIYARCAYVKFGSNSHNYCSQPSLALDDEFYDALFHTIDEKYLEIAGGRSEKQRSDDDIRRQITTIQKEISKHENAIERVFVLYEEGSIDRDTWFARTGTRQKQVEELQNRMSKLHESMKYTKQLSADELDRRMQVFRKTWHKLETPKEQNTALKKILKKIVYDGTGEQAQFEIHFL